MHLYHYRSVKSALLEITNGTFHFAGREELNDPLEGYVSVYWQGDKAAWEGLFKHYICSIAQAVDLYLLGADQEKLLHNTLVIDIHRWDDVPYGSVLLKLRKEFLEDPDVQLLAEFYGNHRFKVFEKELCFVIRMIHNKALIGYLRHLQKTQRLSENEAERIIKVLDVSFKIGDMISKMEQRSMNEKKRFNLMEAVETCYIDEQEFAYIQAAVKNDLILYGGSTTGQDSNRESESMSAVYQQRNWLTVVNNFPRVFVEQLKKIIYPQSYIVCFSGKKDDSSMWGNYADCHRGVCLVYDVGNDNTILVKTTDAQERKLPVKPVIYEGSRIERNFFQTLGRLNRAKIKEWLSGMSEVSSYYDEAYSDVDEWREQYWEIFNAKIYRKTKAWAHEDEYRATIENTFYEFDEPQKRNLKYDWNILKGVIFGLNATEYDKKKIWEALMGHKEELTDFTFYQAEYNEEEQKIKVRKKATWKLK